MPNNLSRYNKFGVALVGLAGEAVNAGLIHGTANHWTALIVAALTALLVRQVPNAGSPNAARNDVPTS